MRGSIKPRRSGDGGGREYEKGRCVPALAAFRLRRGTVSFRFTPS